MAGPVVAAAVLLRQNHKVKRSPLHSLEPYMVHGSTQMKDSKQLTERQRESAYQFLTEHAKIEWGIGVVSEKIIDRINILESAKLAISNAVRELQEKLGSELDMLLLDGNFTVNLPMKQKTFVKGDTFIFSCSAASIIAKVTRDSIMRECHTQYPAYGFDKHKGYGTALHLAMLKQHGPCPLHRMTFRPVCELLQNRKNLGINKKHL